MNGQASETRRSGFLTEIVRLGRRRPSLGHSCDELPIYHPQPACFTASRSHEGDPADRRFRVGELAGGQDHS